MDVKEEEADFVFTSTIPDPSNYSYFPQSSFHPFTETSSVYGCYNYQFQNFKTENLYSQVQGNVPYQNGAYDDVPRHFTRTLSSGQLPSDSSDIGMRTQEHGLKFPIYEFGTYNPFQGSPIEITTLTRTCPMESSNLEPVPSPESVPSELVENQNKPEIQKNKRSYKDVLTFLPRSESPNTEFGLKRRVEPEAKKDSHKEKAVTAKHEENCSPVRMQPARPNLNNFRSRQNISQKKPLNINNNLTGNFKKVGSKNLEKNLNTSNESVRSVRSQTDIGSMKKKNPPPKDHSQDTSLSDDEMPTPVELRMKEKGKEKVKAKVKEKESERCVKRIQRKANPQITHGYFAKTYLHKLYNMCGWICLWLYSLCTDVVRMSCDLALHWLHCSVLFIKEKGSKSAGWLWIHVQSGVRSTWKQLALSIRSVTRFFRRRSELEAEFNHSLSGGLASNIPLPSTGEEAMLRLLACKGRDPYSILGVRRDSSDEEIRRYYKRQAVLVHPDKNRQRGAEEAFKILAHAFELIGQPERRSHYDHLVAEAREMESAWAELNELLSRLHAKMDEAANTIRCTNCAKRHRRVKTSRPCYAARYCQECKIHHSAREGDLWAESRYMGFLCYYFACMEGAVYDITEWANCQATHLRHLQSNSHRVQYRIVPGQGQQSGTNGRKSNQHEETDDESDPAVHDFLRDLHKKSQQRKKIKKKRP